MAKDTEFDSAEAEENVYSGNVREDLVDGDEISAEEEGFMAGYDEAEEEKKEEEDEEDEEKKKKKDDDEEDE